MASSKRVTVKLLVDNEKGRVVLAESDKDFVDILFSFLTLPLATVIRVLGKNSSSLGSFVKVYESVENFGTQDLQSDACKTMLLRPRNATEVQCEDLAINLDDTDFRKFYICQYCSKLDSREYFYSSIPDRLCTCGKLMSLTLRWERKNTKAKEEGVFVKGGSRFLITNDLNVALASAAVLMSLFKSMEIEDASKLEERILDLGPEEIASLLWRSLISMNALTVLHTCEPNKEDATSYKNKKVMLRPKQETDVDCNAKEIKLKLLVTKSSNRVLFAEVEEDMVDLLFSWLTFPLGLLIKHTNNLTNGCIVNLYNNVDSSSCLKSEEWKSMLLSPKLAAFHGCSSQLLKTEETAFETRKIPGYTSHYLSDGSFTSSWVSAIFKELNPKLAYNGTEVGGGYARVSGKYMVTDDLRVFPLSVNSFVHILSEFKISASSLVEREATIGEAQALDLLRAALVSHTVLNDVLCSEKK